MRSKSILLIDGRMSNWQRAKTNASHRRPQNPKVADAIYQRIYLSKWILWSANEYARIPRCVAIGSQIDIDSFGAISFVAKIQFSRLEFDSSRLWRTGEFTQLWATQDRFSASANWSTWPESNRLAPFRRWQIARMSRVTHFNRRCHSSAGLW